MSGAEATETGDSEMITGWHFVADTLRDGSPIPPDGEWLEHDGPVAICQSGLHYSERLIDALQYAPGGTICRVEVHDVVDRHEDKAVARARRILWRVGGEKLLRDFARRCALDVAHLWGAPDAVMRYLATGDESIRAAAWDAAWDAAGAAAWDAARDAARDAAWDAAGAAARAAAWDAARAAARAAAGAAAWATARAAAWDAAGAAVWDAARDKQNRRLTSMVTGKKVGKDWR